MQVFAVFLQATAAPPAFGWQNQLWSLVCISTLPPGLLDALSTPAMDSLIIIFKHCNSFAVHTQIIIGKNWHSLMPGKLKNLPNNMLTYLAPEELVWDCPGSWPSLVFGMDIFAVCPLKCVTKFKLQRKVQRLKVPHGYQGAGRGSSWKKNWRCGWINRW